MRLQDQIGDFCRSSLDFSVDTLKITSRRAKQVNAAKIHLKSSDRRLSTTSQSGFVLIGSKRDVVIDNNNQDVPGSILLSALSGQSFLHKRKPVNNR